MANTSIVNAAPRVLPPLSIRPKAGAREVSSPLRSERPKLPRTAGPAWCPTKDPARESTDRGHRGNHAISATPNACDIAGRCRVVRKRVPDQLDPLADGLGADDQPGPDPLHELIEGEQIRSCPREGEQQLE